MRELQRAGIATEDAVEGALHALREAVKQAERFKDAALAAEEAALGEDDSPDVAWDLFDQVEDLERILEDLVDDAINAKRHAIRARRAAA